MLLWYNYVRLIFCSTYRRNESEASVQQVDSLGDYATIDGAARVTGVPYPTIHKYVYGGKIPAFKLGGKTVLVRISDVRQFARKQSHGDVLH